MKKRAADYDMKTFYLDFKQKVNKQVKEIEDKIEENIAKAAKYRSWLTACKEVLLNVHNIDLNNYPREMIDGEYCSGTKDFKTKASIAYNKAPAGKRNEVVKLLAYLNILTEAYKLNVAKNALNREVNLKFSEYREMLFNYYNKIHELLIKGDAYAIGNSVGTMYLEKKIVPYKRKIIDFNETNKRKKELTEAGIELYDDTKAKVAEKFGMEYLGADYRVFKESNYWFRLNFVKSKFWRSRKYYSFDFADTISAKYRGLTFEQIANMCKTEDEIFTLPCGLRYKVRIYLMKYPDRSINFIRHGKQKIYHH